VHFYIGVTLDLLAGSDITIFRGAPRVDRLIDAILKSLFRLLVDATLRSHLA
jgi:hypothetical protein